MRVSSCWQRIRPNRKRGGQRRKSSGLARVKTLCRKRSETGELAARANFFDFDDARDRHQSTAEYFGAAIVVSARTERSQRLPFHFYAAQLSRINWAESLLP
jgi:hypothetical protein